MHAYNVDEKSSRFSELCVGVSNAIYAVFDRNKVVSCKGAQERSLIVRPSFKNKIQSLAMRLVHRVVMSSHSLTTATLLLTVHSLFIAAIAANAGCAVTTSLLLVQGTQRLAAKGEVFVLNDNRLHPRVSIEVDFAR